MSEFGKYGVGGKMPIPPYKEPDVVDHDLDAASIGTCNYVPDKNAKQVGFPGVLKSPIKTENVGE
jgi:hypothetical protein